MSQALFAPDGEPTAVNVSTPDVHMSPSDFDPQVRALVHYLRSQGDKLAYEDVEEMMQDGYYKAEGMEFLVVDDYDAELKWEDALDNYLEECVLSELPDVAQHYFDREGWINDAKMDGRALYLNTYDGTEYEEEVDGVYYYIYRQY